MNLVEGFQNPVIWCILMTAGIAFAWMFELLLTKPRNEAWQSRAVQALPSLKTLISILPLLGLLGTIVGLLETFELMSIEHGLDPTRLVSSGIADAMFTTQIGLLMVIPGWVVLTLLQSEVEAADVSS
ncbi:MAG: MotA/TolQ/ExbB proton channel family protein [Pseudomonadota bacterium]